VIRSRVAILFISVAIAAQPCWAQVSSPLLASSLEQQLDDFEALDQKLEKLREELKDIRDSATRFMLQEQIDALKLRQEVLLSSLEKLLGVLPLPRHQQPERMLELEERLELRRRHQDAILESNIERRFQTP